MASYDDGASQVKEGITKEFGSIDHDLLDYFTEMFWESIENGQIENEETLGILFADQLTEYEIADRDSVLKLCKLLHKRLAVSGLFDEFLSTGDQKKQRIKEGLTVMALYYEDEEWYEAKIDEFDHDAEEYWVTYNDYGNQECIGLEDIALLDAPEATQEQLDAPVQLANIMGMVDVISKKLYKIMFERVKNLNFTSRELEVLTDEKLMTKDQKKEFRAKKAKKEKYNPKLYQKFLKQQIQKEWFDISFMNRNKDINIDCYDMYTLDDSRQLLNEVHLKFIEGGKYGLVGQNGCGKTTLLRRMSRYDVPDFPKYIRVMHIEQEITGDDKTVLETVLEMDTVYDALKKKEERLMKSDDPNSQVQLAKVIVQRGELGLDDETAQENAKEILSGLLFTEKMMHWPTKQLSGGWRMRVSLAGALFVNPDVLMLDEPTNHLDFPSVIWLERYLQNYENTLIVVSHDREFLNNVVTTVVELDDGNLTYYKGDFYSYQYQREKAYERHQKRYAEYTSKCKEIQKFIDKFRSNAKKAAQVQSRIKSIKAMEVIEKPRSFRTLNFTIPGNSSRDEQVIRFSNLVFGYYSNKLLFRKVNCSLDLSSRVGMIGANGAGKSTFVKLVLRHLKPLHGDCWVNRSARITAFFQHHVDQLDLSKSAVDFLYDLFKEEIQKERYPMEMIRGKLGKFGLGGDNVMRPMHFLSGGQKSRVAFTLMCWKKPDFIIMDEPTNHLDMETCDALIRALADYPGGLLCVSHDQYFLQKVCNQYWTLSENGKITSFREFDKAKKHALSVHYTPHEQEDTPAETEI